MSDDVGVAGLRALLQMHVEGTRNDVAAMRGDTRQILDAMGQLSNKLESSVARIHTRLEEETDKARKDGMAAAEKAEKLAREAHDHAQAAHDLIGREKANLLQRVIGWGIAVVGAGSVGSLVTKKIGGP
jgi:Asp-tRNA(Asn)/Glu-tRNA(Gln) amidotransferase C subunit